MPKITVITGGSYGAGNYAMSGNAATKTLLDIQLQTLKRAGHEPDDEELQALYEQVKAKYDQELDPRYAAARLWVDEIIAPEDTREHVIRALEACAQNGQVEELKVGVFQV